MTEPFAGMLKSVRDAAGFGVPATLIDQGKTVTVMPSRRDVDWAAGELSRRSPAVLVEALAVDWLPVVDEAVVLDGINYRVAEVITPDRDRMIRRVELRR